jgi:hypothetical protein
LIENFLDDSYLESRIMQIYQKRIKCYEHELKQDNAIEGDVYSFHERDEPYSQGVSKKVWSFMLQSFDSDGNPTIAIPVEIRGLKFEGFIRDGHRVKAYGMVEKGEVFQPKKLYNMTTGIWIKRKTLERWQKIAFVIFGIIFFIIIISSLF